MIIKEKRAKMMLWNMLIEKWEESKICLYHKKLLNLRRYHFRLLYGGPVT